MRVAHIGANLEAWQPLRRDAAISKNSSEGVMLTTKTQTADRLDRRIDSMARANGDSNRDREKVLGQQWGHARAACGKAL